VCVIFSLCLCWFLLCLVLGGGLQFFAIGYVVSGKCVKVSERIVMMFPSMLLLRLQLFRSVCWLVC